MAKTPHFLSAYLPMYFELYDEKYFCSVHNLPELFAVLSFLIFCFFFFAPSFWGGVLGTSILIILLFLGTFSGMTNTGQIITVFFINIYFKSLFICPLHLLCLCKLTFRKNRYILFISFLIPLLLYGESGQNCLQC